jgi:hypothetical protein
MKNLLLSTALASSLLLGACGTTGGLNIPAEISTVTSQATAIAQAVCAFVPTAATIGAIAASLFPGGGPIDVVANGVASAICAAVAGTPVPITPVKASISAAVKRSGAKGVAINGIPVEGHFSHGAKRARMINSIIVNGSFTK